MSRRPRRVVPATVAALALLVGGAFVATAAWRALLGQDPTPPLPALGRLAAATDWQDPLALVVGGALLLLGLIMLTCGLLPGTPVVLALDAAGGDSRAGITRSSVRRAVEDAAGGVDGVRSVRARVTRGRIAVHAKAGLRDTTGLSEQLQHAVTARLADIPLTHPARVTVRTTGSRER